MLGLLLLFSSVFGQFPFPEIFQIEEFGVYPGYDGPLKIKGSVTLSFTGHEVSLLYDIEGVEKECKATTEKRPANGCGIHIHVGTSCENKEMIGGHYFKGDSDPWADITYTTLYGNRAVGFNPGVKFGYTVQETVGYLLVLHDHTGARISCNFIGEVLDVSDVGVYPGTTDSPIVGSAKLVFGAHSARLIYDLDGVEESCKVAGDAANSCGIHIHEGMSCANASIPGGHYYNKRDYEEDPWAHIVYVEKANGTAQGSTSVSYGEDFKSTFGRVLVVHDSTGARITCAKIGGKMSLKHFRPYPGYEGHLRVHGSADLYFMNGGVFMQYEIMGADWKCTKPGDKANSCGFHIHENACEAEGGAGGHLFDESVYSSDPWATVTYKQMFDISKGDSKVGYGYDYSKTFAFPRSLVVHDYTGARVSCVTMKVESNLNRLGGSINLDRVESRRV